MAAPAPTNRQTPGGLKLRDGYRSLVTFSLDPNVELWEKAVTPPALDGNEKIDETTYWNLLRRTAAPRSLWELDDAVFTCAYDPNAYNSIILMINRPQTITVRFSDGSVIADFGWLYRFEPQECSEGAQPEATVTVCFSGEDHDDGWEEIQGITGVLVPGT